ncbi:response regulator transcription factor [Oerskovia jenensis]|uniref:response regulator transcription factor n=1 Tax=Oerskovia jenensis TaxID=162169 RepID=UPI0036D7DA25
MRVLVVEDEELIAQAVATGLRRLAMAVDVALDGHEALARIDVNAYDVVVLDRDLPGVHGDDVCRAIVASENDSRVLMLTASGGVLDRVTGLDLGADDYLVKPFAFAELSARVRALGRRARPAAPPVLERSGLRLDTSRHEVYREGRFVHLSRKEFGVLEELLRADGRPVSAEHLLEKVWDENIDPFTGVVRFTIKQLRRKLEDASLVETVTGVGYRVA